MFSYLIRSATFQQPFLIPVIVCRDYKVPWPVPETNRCLCTLAVASGGKVNLSTLLDRNEDREAECCSSRWAAGLHAHGVLGVDNECDLAELILGTWSCAATWSLHKQLVAAVAAHIEKASFKALRAPVPHADALRCATSKITDCLWDVNRLDYEIYRFVLAGREILKDAVHLNWVADKVSDGGLSLHNLLFATAADDGVLSPPQVVTVDSH